MNTALFSTERQVPVNSGSNNRGSIAIKNMKTMITGRNEPFDEVGLDTNVRRYRLFYVAELSNHLITDKCSRAFNVQKN